MTPKALDTIPAQTSHQAGQTPRPKVCMFVYNTFRPDARVLKEANSLTDAGYHVQVLALLDADSKANEAFGQVQVHRLDRKPFHFRIVHWLRTLGRQRGNIAVPTIHSAQNTCISSSQNTPPQPDQSFQETETVSGSRHVFFKKSAAWLIALLLLFAAFGYFGSLNLTWRHWFFALAVICGLVLFRRPFIRTFIRGRRLMTRYIQSMAINLLKRILFPFHKLFSYWDFYKRSYAHVRKAPADIYHAHDLNTLPAAWWCTRRLGGALVYDSHELFTETSLLGGIEKRVWFRLERFLIKKCSLVITVCESIARELENRYAVARPVVLMNCPECMQPDGLEKDLLRKSTGIDAQTPIILYQGGFANNRGLRRLLLASRHFSRGKLVMMGWGNIEEELKAFVRANELEDMVYFIPPAPQSELLSWSASADVGVIPYRAVGLNNYYTCPNKLFEYINSGLPVAGSDFPEIRRIVNSWDLGRTFDPDRPESIAQAVNAILEDPDRAQQMRTNVRNAAEVLNWGRESEKLIQAYRALG